MNKKFDIKKVALISSSHFFHDIYTSFLSTMLPLLINKFQITLFLSSFLDVARKIPTLFNPLFGLTADKMKIEYFVIFCPAFTAISMSLIGIANSYAGLIILLMLSGISNALFHISTPVLIKRYSGKNTATGMSYCMLFGESARTLGPILIAFILLHFGLERSYIVMPIGIITSVVLYMKLKKMVPKEKVSKKEKITKPIKEAKKFIPFFISVGGFIIFRAGIKLVLTLFLTVFLTKKGLSLWISGVFLSILQFSGAISSFASGYISDKIGYKNMLLLTALFTPLFTWFISISNNTFLIPVLLLPVGFFIFSPGPVILGLVQDLKSEYPAFINSIYMTLNFCISSLLVIIVGYSGDKLGLETTIVIFSALSLFSIPFVFLIHKYHNP